MQHINTLTAKLRIHISDGSDDSGWLIPLFSPCVVRGSNGRPLYAAAFIRSNQFMASTHIYWQRRVELPTVVVGLASQAAGDQWLCAECGWRVAADFLRADGWKWNNLAIEIVDRIQYIGPVRVALQTQNFQDCLVRNLCSVTTCAVREATKDQTNTISVAEIHLAITNKLSNCNKKRKRNLKSVAWPSFEYAWPSSESAWPSSEFAWPSSESAWPSVCICLTFALLFKDKNFVGSYSCFNHLVGFR